MQQPVIIASEIQQQFMQLAILSDRTDSDIIHEALVGYLAADRRYVEVLQERIALADDGAFASDAEVEAFFCERNS